MKIAIGVPVAILAVVLSLPLFVNGNTFRPEIEKQLSVTLDRKVTLGDIKLSAFHGWLVAKDLTVEGDPNFSTTPFLTAKELRIGVGLKPLIFAHKINLRSFEIVEPQINIVRAANGVWNFSTIGVQPSGIDTSAGVSPSNNVARSSGGTLPTPPDLTIGFFAIRDGRATVTLLPERGDPSVYTKVNLTAHDLSFTSKVKFELSAVLPGGGALGAVGTVGPLNRNDSATSPADVNISVNGLDPVAAGFLNPNAGVR